MKTFGTKAEARAAALPGDWIMLREWFNPRTVSWATCTHEERSRLDLSWISQERMPKIAILEGEKK